MTKVYCVKRYKSNSLSLDIYKMYFAFDGT